MLGYRHRDGGFVSTLLHHDMAATSPYLNEPVVGEDVADVGS
jgi:hypothetical protein